MTEWLMLTSGTSGAPKIVEHTLEGLTGAIVAVPATIRFVGELDVTPAGKLARADA
jgi:acyl-coenzyme A synthetase/AMP-(fatty) acid ligase